MIEDAISHDSVGCSERVSGRPPPQCHRGCCPRGPSTHILTRRSSGEFGGRKKLRLRETIAATAIRMFLAAGFDAVSITDIAREAEVQRELALMNYECLVNGESAADRYPKAVQATDRAFDLLRDGIERYGSKSKTGGAL